MLLDHQPLALETPVPAPPPVHIEPDEIPPSAAQPTEHVEASLVKPSEQTAARQKASPKANPISRRTTRSSSKPSSPASHAGGRNTVEVKPKTKQPRTASRSSKAEHQNKSSKTTHTQPSAGHPSPSRQATAPARKKQPVPEVPVSINARPVTPGVDVPLFKDTYSDLDSILEGDGDASPLMIRKPAEEQPVKKAVGPEDKPYHVAREKKSLGFYCALISGTVAFWFGIFVVAVRFYQFEVPLLSGWSEQMRAAAFSVFGLTEVPITMRNMFSMLSWGFWTVGLLLVFAGTIQVVNAFVQLLLRRPLVRWIDGVVAAIALVGVVFVIGMVINQASFQNTLLADLNTPQGIEVGGGFEEQNRNKLQAEYDDIANKFNFAMYFNVFVAGAVLVLSSLRVYSNVVTKEYRRIGSDRTG